MGVKDLHYGVSYSIIGGFSMGLLLPINLISSGLLMVDIILGLNK